MQGHTTKRPVLTAIERPIEVEVGDAPGAVSSMPLSGVSGAEVSAALTGTKDGGHRIVSDRSLFAAKTVSAA